MKNTFLIIRLFLGLVVSVSLLEIQGCGKDDDNPESSKSPLWVYQTQGDPYESKPAVSGDKVIIYCQESDQTTGQLYNIQCINRNTGAMIWKNTDSLSLMAMNPVIYNNMIISGGMNPHALNLDDGTPAWKYEDDLIPNSLYNNPLLVGSAVYFASYLSVTKHSANSGGLVWETEGEHFWYNLRNSSLVYKNGMLYFGDAYLNRITAFHEPSGLIDWYKTYEKPFANMPAVTDNEIYIGIQDSDIGNKTLRCLNLADQSEKWAVKLGVIFSDVVVSGDKVYAIGMTTLHCRSANDGSEIWHYDLSSGAVSEPLVAGDKIILGYGNGLLCLQAATGEQLWEFKTKPGQDGAGFSSPTLDGDRFYVACSDGNLYCFSLD